ncbi:hypothetical protein HYZ98_01405 [Candidatus Peregrinibacteria bacterium]|nr:hypothetical protein [Candidatus Peregrinibacteria bacterium]
MIFSRENAGKWVASKNSKVIDASRKLPVLLKKIEKRDDRQNIRFARVPKNLNITG